jgi:hypothetical protein
MEYLIDCKTITQLDFAIFEIKKILKHNLYQNTNISNKDLQKFAELNESKFNNEWIKLKKSFDSIFNLINIKKIEQLEWYFDKELDLNYQGYLYSYVRNSLFSMRFEKKVKYVSVSASDTIHLITLDNQIYTKGKNSFGQTGVLNDDKEVKEWTQLTDNSISTCYAIFSGYAFTHFLCPNKVVSCGCCENGRLGNNTKEGNVNFSLVDIDEKVKKIGAGSTNSYFLTDSGKVYSCGHHYYVGFISTKDIIKPTEITFPTNYPIVDIACTSGCYHCIVLDSNGQAFSWGHNRVGQLGFDPKSELMSIKLETDASSKNDMCPILLLPKKINYPYPIFKIMSGWGHSGFISNGKLFLFGRGAEGQLNLALKDCKKNNRKHRYQDKLICAKTPGFLPIKNANVFNTVSTIEVVSLNPKVKPGIYFCGRQTELRSEKLFEFEHVKRSERHTEFKIISDKYVVCKQLSPNREMC